MTFVPAESQIWLPLCSRATSMILSIERKELAATPTSMITTVDLLVRTCQSKSRYPKRCNPLEKPQFPQSKHPPSTLKDHFTTRVMERVETPISRLLTVDSLEQEPTRWQWTLELRLKTISGAISPIQLTCNVDESQLTTGKHKNQQSTLNQIISWLPTKF